MLHVRFLHYEERYLLGDASGALRDAYQMRTAFELSPDILVSDPDVANITQLVWGAKSGESSEKGKTVARRVIFTFTLDDGEGSEDDGDDHGALNYWKWRVVGHPAFWRLGGKMAIMDKTTNTDLCQIQEIGRASCRERV